MPNDTVPALPSAQLPRPITHVLQIPIGMVNPNDSDARFLLNRAVFGLLHGAAASDVVPAYVGHASATRATDAPQDMSWEAAVDRLMNGGNFVLAARSSNYYQIARLLRDAAERIENGEWEHHDESEDEGLWFRFALIPARAAASQGGKASETR